MFNFIKNKSFYKTFFKIALPVMFSTLLTTIINMVDSIMIGQYSGTGVSAIYTVNQVSFVFNILIFGILGGCGIYIQQYYGARDKDGLRQAFHFKLVLITLFLILGIPLLYVYGKNLIELYIESDPENGPLILEEAWQYMSLVLISFIPFSYMVVFLTSLEETGHTTVTIYSALISLIINISLNSFLINGFGSFKAMGVKGAAIATIVARTFEMIFLVSISFIRKMEFVNDIFNFKIEGLLIKNILKKSWPIFLNELLWSLGATMFSLAYSHRPNVLGALAIEDTASQIFNIIFNGFGTGIGVMVGHKLGQDRFKEAKEDSKRLIFLSLVVGLGVGVILFMLSPVIPMFYKEVTESEKQLATYLIMVYSVCLTFFALLCSIFMILQAGGQTIRAFSIDAVICWTVAVPLAFLLTYFTSLPIPLIFFFVLGVDGIKCIIGYHFYRNDCWVRNVTNLN